MDSCAPSRSPTCALRLILIPQSLTMKLTLPLLVLLAPLTRAIPTTHSDSARHSEAARWTDDPSDHLPPGYVTTKGSQFWLDHYPYYFNGANIYWLQQLVYDRQVTQVFEELKELGVKVIRTWAFSSVVDEIPSNNLTYYQVRNGSPPSGRIAT